MDSFHGETTAAGISAATSNVSLFTWDFAPFYREILYGMMQQEGVAFMLQTAFSTITAHDFYLLLPERKDLEPFIANGTINTLKPHFAVSTARLQTALPSPVPTENLGLHIVCGLVGLHLIVVAIVFWMFFTSRAPKFLDQAWLTLAQLHMGETTGEFTRAQIASLVGDTEIAPTPWAQEVAKIWANDTISHDNLSSTQSTCDF
jgi:hypothetical protein